MRHRVKKIRCQSGKDANKMLLRKLVINFIKKGKITTTITKGKILKSAIERIVEKTKKKNEANKNYLLKKLADPNLVKVLLEQVGPALVDKIGGYVKLTRLHERSSDGTVMSRLNWVYPVVIEETESRPSKTQEKKPKVSNRKETKTKAKK